MIIIEGPTRLNIMQTFASNLLHDIRLSIITYNRRPRVQSVSGVHSLIRHTSRNIRMLLIEDYVCVPHNIVRMDGSSSDEWNDSFFS